jgi:hypothetical protein
MPIKLAIIKTSWALCAVFSLMACQSTPDKKDSIQQEPRWFNPQVFEGVGTSPYDLEFENEFYAADNGVLTIRNCADIAVVGDGNIAEREYTRWQALKVDCEAADRFYLAPESAVSHWPASFDFTLLKTLPATAMPYLGGQGLDGRNGNLAKIEPALTLQESSEHSVKVSFDSMVVNYVVVTRGDFNRDGFQDVFVRMDWYVEDAFGEGHDWIVLTKFTPEALPTMLWRK